MPPAEVRDDAAKVEVRISCDQTNPPVGRLWCVSDPVAPGNCAAQPIAFSGWLGLLRALYDALDDSEAERANRGVRNICPMAAAPQISLRGRDAEIDTTRRRRGARRLGAVGHRSHRRSGRHREDPPARRSVADGGGPRMRGCPRYRQRDGAGAPVRRRGGRAWVAFGRPPIPGGPTSPHCSLRTSTAKRARSPSAVTPDLRFRAVDAFSDLVETLVRQRPLVIGVDDLQWADPSSLLTLSPWAGPPSGCRWRSSGATGRSRSRIRCGAGRIPRCRGRGAPARRSTSARTTFVIWWPKYSTRSRGRICSPKSPALRAIHFRHRIAEVDPSDGAAE